MPKKRRNSSSIGSLEPAPPNTLRLTFSITRILTTEGPTCSTSGVKSGKPLIATGAAEAAGAGAAGAVTACAWLAAGCPEDLSAFKTTYEEARIEGIKMLGELKNMACKDKPLGDESRRFEVDDDSPANKKVDDLLRKVKGVLKKD